MQNKQIEEELEKRFGKPAITEKRLTYYYRRGWIKDVIEGRRDLAWLFENVSDLLEYAEGRRPASPPSLFLDTQRKNQIMTRDSARSEILAYLAGKDERVREFRRRYLKDKLMDRSQVEEFIESSGRAPKANFNPPKLPIGWKLVPQFLEYGSVKDNWVRRTPVVNEMLHDLKAASEWLGRRYGWQEAQAVVFILAGTIPWSPAITTKTPIHLVLDPVVTPIHLVLDPAVTPRELDKYYRDLRRRSNLTRKSRTLSEKHLRLAVLACNRELEGKSWKAALASWNKQNKKIWRYDQESNFRRDALKARERLSAPAQ